MTDGAIVAGKFQLVKLIGRGGMGAVYDAIHLGTGRRVAVKLVAERLVASASPALERFAREAKAAAAVDSLHVVQILDCGEDDASGLPFIVMEHLEGEDLKKRLARGALAPDVAISIATQAALGLARAHEADIVHRDLKPANVFLARIDDREVVKVLDFGIAKLVDEGAILTKTGDVLGSARYMAPEQQQSPRDVDARADVWSLGVVLFEMLTGHVPSPMTTPRAELSAFAPDLVAVVERALFVDRNERFESAREMADALTRCAAPARPARRRRWVPAAIVAATAAASAAMVILTRPGIEHPIEPAPERVESTAAVLAPASVDPPACTATATAIVPPKPARRPPPKKTAPQPTSKARYGRDEL